MSPIAHNALWVSTRPVLVPPSHPTVMFHIAVNVSIGSYKEDEFDSPQGRLGKNSHTAWSLGNLGLEGKEK